MGIYIPVEKTKISIDEVNTKHSQNEFIKHSTYHVPSTLLKHFINLGIKPRPPTLQVDSLPTEPPGKLLQTLPDLIFTIVWKYL